MLKKNRLILFILLFTLLLIVAAILFFNKRIENIRHNMVHQSGAINALSCPSSLEKGWDEVKAYSRIHVKYVFQLTSNASYELFFKHYKLIHHEKKTYIHHAKQ